MNAQVGALPIREEIVSDEHWRVAHAYNAELDGWVVLVPRRHVTAIADLTDAEAAGLGAWQVRLSRALHAVTGCVKTYVVAFGEAEGHSHVHFHIIPRAADAAARGPEVFTHLGTAREAGQLDQVAARIRASLSDPPRRNPTNAAAEQPDSAADLRSSEGCSATSR